MEIIEPENRKTKMKNSLMDSIANWRGQRKESANLKTLTETIQYEHQRENRYKFPSLAKDRFVKLSKSKQDKSKEIFPQTHNQIAEN